MTELSEEVITSRIDLQIQTGVDIKTFYENVKKLGHDKRTIPRLETYLEKIENSFANFNDKHHEIFTSLTSAKRKTISYFTSSFYHEICDTVDEVKILLKSWLELNKQTVNASVLNSSMVPPQVVFPDNITITQAPRSEQVRLPAINIDPFSGDYHKWATFKSLYENLIHNSANINQVEKFCRLKTILKGEALTIISHYNITEENYEAAWSSIKNRYDNKRALVNHELKLLLNQPRLSSESPQKLKQMLDLTNECLNALKNLEINTESWDPILSHILVQKIDCETHRHWENSIANPKELPSLKSFLEFLENRSHTLENLSTNNASAFNLATSSNTQSINRSFTNNLPQNQRTNFGSRQIKNNSYANSKQNLDFNRRTHQESSHKSFTTRTEKCLICGGTHNVFNCAEFLRKNPEQRLEAVKNEKLCKNCFGNHHVMDCSSSSRCKQCQHLHHTLLHNNASPKNSNPFYRNTDNNHDVKSFTSTTNGFENSTQTEVLLATATIKAIASNGEKHYLRCLIDQGSQVSFITEAAAQLLRLKKTAIIASVSGVGAAGKETSKSIVKFDINSRYDYNFELSIEALVLSKLTSSLPASFITIPSSWHHLKSIFLADPNYNKPGQIDVLLGADVFSSILLEGVKKGCIGSPVAQETCLGWILSGKTSIQQQKANSKSVLAFHQRIDLDTQVKKFWEMEEMPSERIFTQEEEECERHFVETHRRDESGRFIVGLPFKSNRNAIGKSKYRAKQRFLQLLNKFNKNSSFKKQYSSVIKEYIDLGHMVKSSSSQSGESYYLPHHAVIKESSTTTKMRIVFDASAKSSSGESLNDQLLVGPTIQQDLASILLRWRTHKVILSADITKMYRQIWLRDEEKRFHKILWQNAKSNRIEEYELQTVTFGTASAAFLAIRSLQQLAKYESKIYPKAADIVLRDFYVDDLLTGCDTTEEAIELQHQISILLQFGGFQLRKWITNDTTVLQNIPEDHRELSLPLKFELDNTTKTLGMHYHPAVDAFQFKVPVFAANACPTKRSLLSDISRLFDPLGWLAPVIVKAKILLQRVWHEGYDWDHELKGEIRDEWLKYQADLTSLGSIRILRWCGKHNQSKVQLHGFCDASEKAYSAVVYARINNHGKNIIVTMIAAKTKVAPLSLISIPRLELCGALLLAKLMSFVKRALVIENLEEYCWTDSEIVLAWLRGKPAKYKTFIANKIVQILNHTSVSQWRHIVSEENPADCASRGIFPNELQDHQLWWTGPKWLLAFNKENHSTGPEYYTELEAKSKVIVNHLIINEKIQFINRYSSLSKLIRITALLRRFKSNCQSPSGKRAGPLTVVEHRDAMEVCIKIVQDHYFYHEMHQIKNKHHSILKGNLLSLNPFIDNNGILRVDGRLKYANLSFDQKHQILIPPKSNFAKLLIADAHIRSEHGGIQITLSTLRNKYWVINARNAVKKFVHDCITCKRYSKIPNNQLMGSLPKDRLHADRPFMRTGVDYCGPYEMKASKLRNAKKYKGYIALFVCMSTKAVHIEVVSELSTEAFLAAFDRFVGRRGLPSDMYSDNGTNFVGADRVLKRLVKNSTSFNDIKSSASQRGVNWHFIPPRSPHFGGLWEAGIKSLKKHLVRIIGPMALTFEELSTIVIKIEAVLNSRPLTPLTDDPNDFVPLTPGHFLIGHELIAPPTEDFSAVNINLIKRWKLLNKIHADFWKRWKTEYLNSLQQRNKWRYKKRESKIGDLVLLKDDNLPPCRWSLARITEVCPGGDGHVRVVIVKTPHGIFKRAISKIHPLINESSEDENDEEQ